jgi:NADH-quinone oxidoreductase subunit L
VASSIRSISRCFEKVFIDEIYSFFISATQGVLASISAFVDRWISTPASSGASGATWGFGSILRLLQGGNLQAYSFLFGLGIVGLIYFTLFR